MNWIFSYKVAQKRLRRFLCVLHKERYVGVFVIQFIYSSSSSTTTWSPFPYLGEGLENKKPRICRTAYMKSIKYSLKTEQSIETKLKVMCELASVELYKTTVQALGLLVSFS